MATVFVSTAGPDGWWWGRWTVGHSDGNLIGEVRDESARVGRVFGFTPEFN